MKVGSMKQVKRSLALVLAVAVAVFVVVGCGGGGGSVESARPSPWGSIGWNENIAVTT